MPGRVGDFYAALDAARPQIDALGVRLAGAFHTAGATGRWNEMFVYWEFDDMAHFGRVMAEHDGPGSLSDLADPDWQGRAGAGTAAA